MLGARIICLLACVEEIDILLSFYLHWATSFYLWYCYLLYQVPCFLINLIQTQFFSLFLICILCCSPASCVYTLIVCMECLKSFLSLARAWFISSYMYVARSPHALAPSIHCVYNITCFWLTPCCLKAATHSTALNARTISPSMHTYVLWQCCHDKDMYVFLMNGIMCICV